MLARLAGAVCVMLSLWPAPLLAAEDIRFEVPSLPGFQRYADLLALPGLLAVALENNDLSPSQSSKLKVTEHGKAAEIRRATLRFTGRKGQVFTYEAGYLLGVGDAKVGFPVAVDLSGLASGKITVILSPPMASLIPAELTDRIRLKSQLIANPDAQRKLLAYLDRTSKEGDLARVILIDAYNRSAVPVAVDTRDAGDALPLSDQWMLILTLVIWLVAVPALLLWFRRRARRAPGKPA